MMTKQNGFIEAKSADGKRFKLQEGDWYSAFKADQIKAEKGDFVEFNYQMNGTFRNVKGNVAKATAPADAAITPMTGGGKKAWVEKTFPLPPLHPDRTIVRQNSLGHAVKVAEYHDDEYHNSTEHAERVIEIARMFEAYSCGDLDQEIADEAVKQMMAREIS